MLGKNTMDEEINKLIILILHSDDWNIKKTNGIIINK